MDRLLQLLKAKARTTAENLAQQLGEPAADVAARMRDYEARGVIRGYQAILDEDQLDLGRVPAVIEVKITPEREGGFNKVSSRIAKFSEVQSVDLMSGAYDLLLFVAGKDLREVAMFVSEKLATLEGVISTSTHFMLKTYKHHGLLMETEHEDERLKVSP